jgi:chemotaxis methyl-accepting protein methylase
MKGGAEALTAEVVEAMTTNETFFFRDKIPFDHLQEAVLPALVQARAARAPAHLVRGRPRPDRSRIRSRCA